MRRKEERSKQGQTNNKAKQHSTPMYMVYLQLPILSPLFWYRKKFREDYGGLDLLLNIIDMAMIGRGSPSTATPDVAMETTGTAVATERSHDVLQNGGAVAIETQSDETEAVTVEATSTSSTDAEEDHVTSSDSGVPDKYSLPLPPSRSSVNILPTPLSEQCMGWISEAMKIVFNQTAHWKHDGNYDDVSKPTARETERHSD